jgi:hypothetical protein
MSGTSGVKLPRKPKGQRPRYFDDPAVDRLVGMIMALAGEVAVMHDRHDTFERIAAEKGLIGRDEIERYRPSAEVAAERDRWREIYLGEVLRVVQQDLEALEKDSAEPYETIVEVISEE